MPVLRDCWLYWIHFKSVGAQQKPRPWEFFPADI